MQLIITDEFCSAQMCEGLYITPQSAVETPETQNSYRTIVFKIIIYFFAFASKMAASIDTVTPRSHSNCSLCACLFVCLFSKVKLSCANPTYSNQDILIIELQLKQTLSKVLHLQNKPKCYGQHDNGVGDLNASFIDKHGQNRQGQNTSKHQHPRQDKRVIQTLGGGQGRQQSPE